MTNNSSTATECFEEIMAGEDDYPGSNIEIKLAPSETKPYTRLVFILLCESF